MLFFFIFNLDTNMLMVGYKIHCSDYNYICDNLVVVRGPWSYLNVRTRCLRTTLRQQAGQVVHTLAVLISCSLSILRE